jgi:hypothetical protein
MADVLIAVDSTLLRHFMSQLSFNRLQRSYYAFVTAARALVLHVLEGEA